MFNVIYGQIINQTCPADIKTDRIQNSTIMPNISLSERAKGKIKNIQHRSVYSHVRTIAIEKVKGSASVVRVYSVCSSAHKRVTVPITDELPYLYGSY